MEEAVRQFKDVTKMQKNSQAKCERNLYHAHASTGKYGLHKTETMFANLKEKVLKS